MVVNKIKAVIVEDNPYFAQMFKVMLEKYERLKIVGVYGSGENFISSLRTGISVDVVFLDIDLPGIKGSILGNKLKENRPNIQVVFVTGTTDFAAEAFDIEAADYLVKPFDDKRLERSLNRIAIKLESIPKYIPVKTRNNIMRLDIKNILFIEKDKKHTVFITSDGDYQSSDTIESIDNKLRTEGFLRTHKSYIVNPLHVKKIKRWADRAYTIEFNSDDRVALLSRSNLERFKESLPEME